MGRTEVTETNYQEQKDSEFQDKSKDQSGKTAQLSDQQEPPALSLCPLTLTLFTLCILVWFLDLDSGPGGDQQRRRELFQRSTRRVEEMKARRALEKSRSNSQATPFEVKQPSRVKRLPPVAATCQVKSAPRRVKPDVKSKSCPAERPGFVRQKKVQPSNEGIGVNRGMPGNWLSNCYKYALVSDFQQEIPSPAAWLTYKFAQRSKGSWPCQRCTRELRGTL